MWFINSNQRLLSMKFIHGIKSFWTFIMHSTKIFILFKPRYSPKNENSNWTKWQIFTWYPGVRFMSLFRGVSPCVLLDLGYAATSYPDISIIRLWSCSVYCLFFIHFHIKSCSKQKQSGWISVLFYSISILCEW